jgi:hypothetical protein
MMSREERLFGDIATQKHPNRAAEWHLSAFEEMCGGVKMARIVKRPATLLLNGRSGRHTHRRGGGPRIGCSAIEWSDGVGSQIWEVRSEFL